ncbi:hypothetical protein JCM12298_26730 [Desulfothermus naphthae]
MPIHEIFMKIPSKTVLNKDVEFHIYSDNEKLGTLRISKGSIEWKPKSHIKGFHLEWEKFDALMRENGTQP